MASFRFRVFTIAAASVALSASAARADGAETATQDALQAVITQQIDALGRDDVTAAQSFAAPAIKRIFPDPNAFNAMVHQSYAPLIHPKSTHFESGGSTPLGPIEKVTIVDDKGQVWTAIYSFEQVDGQWRINGCALVRDQSTDA